MKPALCSLLLLLAVTPCFSQRVHFSDVDNRWDVSVPYASGGQCWQCKLHYFYSDTMISNGFNYLALSATGNTSDSALIREDTLAGKVYARVYRNTWVTPDTSEVLLYDYNLQEGDTFKIAPSPTHQFVHVVDSVLTVSLNNAPVKAMHFKSLTPQGEEYWIIEGLGCVNTPMFPFFPSTFDQRQDLYCFHWRGFNPDIQPTVTSVEFLIMMGSAISSSFLPYSNTNTCLMLSVAQSQPLNVAKITIAPNPTHTSAILRIQASTSPKRFTLTDYSGRTIQDVTFSNQSELIIPHPGVAGVYFYKLREMKTGVSHTGKLWFR